MPDIFIKIGGICFGCGKPEDSITEDGIRYCSFCDEPWMIELQRKKKNA